MTEKTLKGMPEELARSALLSEIEFLFVAIKSKLLQLFAG